MSLEYMSAILPSLLQGATLTLQVFFWTLLGSLPLGILVSLGLNTHFKPLRWVLDIYVWLMRGTPLLLQLIIVFMAYRLLGLSSHGLKQLSLLLSLIMGRTSRKFSGVGYNQLIKANTKEPKSYG